MEIEAMEVEAKEGASGALYTVIKWTKCDVCNGRGTLYTPDGDVGCFGGCEQSGYIVAGQVEWNQVLDDLGITARIAQLVEALAQSPQIGKRLDAGAKEAARLSAHYEWMHNYSEVD
jgi:hypothetical protein